MSGAAYDSGVTPRFGLWLVVAALMAPAPASAAVFFDDFAYSSAAQLTQHGWQIRTEQGWPGSREATWSPGAVTFTHGLMRLTSSTDGTPAGTTEAQVCHQRKYREGTWASRVRFRDAPRTRDVLVETFYAISPLVRALDPSYSEIDWEYLPHGGWGQSGPTLWTTTWETAQLDPWIADNATQMTSRSLDGWHVLVHQVANGTVTYYLDGARLASHGGKYYPEVLMSLNYNLWFVDGGLGPVGPRRSYSEDVDWALQAPGVVLSPTQVLARVRSFRAARVAFRDTVPAPMNPLPSPCNF
jgi:hypothetical protein